MPHDEKPGEGPAVPQGLAGGPGPAPPGFDDGTPKMTPDTPAAPLGTAAEEGSRARTSDDERRAARGDPEEPDPS